MGPITEEPSLLGSVVWSLCFRLAFLSVSHRLSASELPEVVVNSTIPDLNQSLCLGSENLVLGNLLNFLRHEVSMSLLRTKNSAWLLCWLSGWMDRRIMQRWFGSG